MALDETGLLVKLETSVNKFQRDFDKAIGVVKELNKKIPVRTRDFCSRT